MTAYCGKLPTGIRNLFFCFRSLLTRIFAQKLSAFSFQLKSCRQSVCSAALNEYCFHVHFFRSSRSFHFFPFCCGLPVCHNVRFCSENSDFCSAGSAAPAGPLICSVLCCSACGRFFLTYFLPDDKASYVIVHKYLRLPQQAFLFSRSLSSHLPHEILCADVFFIFTQIRPIF